MEMMDYKSLKAEIGSFLNDAAEDFFMVGYCLRQVSSRELYAEDGYRNIWEFAKGGIRAEHVQRQPVHGSQ